MTNSRICSRVAGMNEVASKAKHTYRTFSQFLKFQSLVAPFQGAGMRRPPTWGFTPGFTIAPILGAGSKDGTHCHRRRPTRRKTMNLRADRSMIVQRFI